MGRVREFDEATALTQNLFQDYYGGTFEQDRDRVFWDVRRPENAVVITLDNEDFSRLIIEVDNPSDTVKLIEQAIAAHA